MSQPSAAMVIYELMRMIEGRHEMYSHPDAVHWLFENEYCFQVRKGVEVYALTVKGERFAETIIAKSGIIPILEDQ